MLKKRMVELQPTSKEGCKSDIDFNMVECYISIGNLKNYLKKTIITKQNKLTYLSWFIWKYNH